MRIPPDLDEVVHGKRGMLRGIQVCVRAQCLVSAVSLVYSTIDALAALTRPACKKDTDRQTFIGWIEKYVLAKSELGFTAQDAYAARCGVLHAYSHGSRMARRGKARPLVYRWRKGPSADQVAPLPAEAIEVAVEDLVSALKEGIRLFLIDVEMNPDLKKTVLSHLKEALCYRPWPPLKAHVAAAG